MSNSIKMIDPLGPLGLTAKYKKALEKGTIGALRLEFTPTGVQAVGLRKGGNANNAADWLPLVEALAASKPTNEERPLDAEKAYVANKYEVRLDEEAPASLRNASSAEELNAAIAALPFKKRRALQMSNREFELAFLRWEEGRPVPRSAESAEELRIAQQKKTSGGKPNAPVTRGQGPKGKGKGSFRESPGEPAEVPSKGKTAQ
eukprot:GHVU01040275.1.p2 GENE.GHVU01040275.1~~GHVU01040275.1.p2  ORF type:complete len:204 (+),score=20.05 GHVU01040275.1:115-726(+)